MTKLLTRGNPKLDKATDYGYISAGLFLAPANVAGRGNVCPFASEGCKAACLNTAGAALWAAGKQKARQWRTDFYFDDRKAFYAMLVKEIATFERYAAKQGLKPTIRLNGTSDIKWPLTIFKQFPNIMFMDYTKNMNAKPRAVNHHLTYSRCEDTSLTKIRNKVNAGKNVAVVFESGTIPKKWHGMPVVTGMKHDLRFLGKQGAIVGLDAIGKAKQDQTGFVVR